MRWCPDRSWILAGRRADTTERRRSCCCKGSRAPVIETGRPHRSGAIVALVFGGVLSACRLFAGVAGPVLERGLGGGIVTPDPGRALARCCAAGALGAIAGTLHGGFPVSSRGLLGLTLAVVNDQPTCATAVHVPCGGRACAGPRPPWPQVSRPIAAARWSLAAPSPCDLESDYFCIRSFDVSADPARPVPVDGSGPPRHGNVRGAPIRDCS